MGTIYKFKRPPKNQQQFKGYRPLGPGGPGRGKPPRKAGFWQKLKPWQRSVLAWVLLVAIAAGIVGVRTLIA